MYFDLEKDSSLNLEEESNSSSEEESTDESDESFPGGFKLEGRNERSESNKKESNNSTNEIKEEALDEDNKDDIEDFDEEFSLLNEEITTIIQSDKIETLETESDLQNEYNPQDNPPEGQNTQTNFSIDENSETPIAEYKSEHFDNKSTQDKKLEDDEKFKPDNKFSSEEKFEEDHRFTPDKGFDSGENFKSQAIFQAEESFTLEENHTSHDEQKQEAIFIPPPPIAVSNFEVSENISTSRNESIIKQTRDPEDISAPLEATIKENTLKSSLTPQEPSIVEDDLMDQEAEEEGESKPEELLRDLEKELSEEIEKSEEKQAELEAEERIVRRNLSIIEAARVKGKKREDKTKKQVGHENQQIKSAKKNKHSRKNTKRKKEEKSLQYSSENAEEKASSNKKSKSLLGKIKKSLEKLVSYKIYSIRKPGNQAGVFDNAKDAPKKRTLKHDFEVSGFKHLSQLGKKTPTPTTHKHLESDSRKSMVDIINRGGGGGNGIGR